MCSICAARATPGSLTDDAAVIDEDVGPGVAPQHERSARGPVVGALAEGEAGTVEELVAQGADDPVDDRLRAAHVRSPLTELVQHQAEMLTLHLVAASKHIAAAPIPGPTTEPVALEGQAGADVEVVARLDPAIELGAWIERPSVPSRNQAPRTGGLDRTNAPAATIVTRSRDTNTASVRATVGRTDSRAGTRVPKRTGIDALAAVPCARDP